MGVMPRASEPPVEYQGCAHPIACPLQSTRFCRHGLASTFFIGDRVTLADAGWEATPHVGLEPQQGRGKGYGELNLLPPPRHRCPGPAGIPPAGPALATCQPAWIETQLQRLDPDDNTSSVKVQGYSDLDQSLGFFFFFF